MKFLEVATLDHINSALVFDTPECKVFGRIEPYSCKVAGADKKLYKYLESRYNEEISNFSSSISPENSLNDIISPFGPMNQPSTRRTLFNLIATLNASYPDYDFSDVRPEQFIKQPSISNVCNYINNTLFNLQHGWIVTDLNLWKIVDDIIDLEECDVYSFDPDMDSDPNTEEGAIWSFNFFFYNKKMKRILFFTVRGLSVNAPLQEDESLSDSSSDSEIIGRAMPYEEYVMGDIEM
ncbi:1917_t:CDS:2 [Ambispora gerdemannii]|uniref:Repressor of RNA polymerase III transcription MAF1 n=1 Tax=Ambispora gerdemannii TaxID=144530 RepID=A0A9N9GTJ6_9GLOM|nr:1917_t:CDS:2 [Ambispora gerdemannii]